MIGAIVHIAGNDVQVGSFLRQRCAWCGAVLEDYDLDRVAVETRHLAEDGTFRPSTWPPGGLVEVDGVARWTVLHNDGDVLPANACAQLDVEVTR